MASRLPRHDPEVLDDQQRAVYHELTRGDRADGPFRLVEADGSLTGPFGAMVLAPSVGGPLGRLGAAIRYGASLTARVREIVILAVAAHHQSHFEWYAHERAGQLAGLTAVDFAAIQRADYDHWHDPAERAAHRIALASLARRRLPDDSYAEAKAALGLTGLIEVVVAIGYYSSVDLLLSTFEIGLPAGEALLTPLDQP